MTEESRRDWLAVAWDTLKHIPSDILESGARIARQKCDHPAKIVPTIIAETSERMSFRSRTSHWDQPQLPAPKVECVTPEEVAEILRSVGIKPAFASPKEGEDNG